MRPPRILKISLTDEARLQTLASLTLTPWSIAGILSALVVIMLLLGYLVVLLTPLKTLIPGYFRESQRAQTQEALLRVDSIREAFMQNESYIANLTHVLDTHRPAMKIPEDTGSAPIAADSLLPPSKQETSFVRMMQEREKFNIAVASPLAAEGMLFYPVTEEGIFASETRDSRRSRLILPEGSSIMAVADGIVLGSFYEPSVGGYSIIIQHDNGFVSRYSALGSPLVGESDIVNGGQIISLPPRPRKGHPAEVWVQLWHDSAPLKPYDYVSSPHYYSSLQQ